MKIVQINATCGIGSTGKICVGIGRLLAAGGIENHILCSKTNGDPLGISCASDSYIKLQSLKSRVLGNYGFNSARATRRMIAELERIQPDIVHLHNIHGHDCNLEMLFSWFRKNKIKLVWTFHDCWAFTGYCPHFVMEKCEKWKTQCLQCGQRSASSWFLDRSKALFEKKKACFAGQNLTVVTPSRWLAEMAGQSFMKKYSVNVIHNGIDLSVFQPTSGAFRQKYGLENKKLILGVAFDWGIKKGLDVFVDLAEKLPADYQIVLVGTNERIDRGLPSNVLSIHRTQNQKELVEIYSEADVFVNPTREDSFPTVNMEALACGTPVVTFRTGGSPEMLDDTCGSVVDCDDVEATQRQILRICETKPFTKEQCLKKAQTFDQNERFKEYLKLYERIITAGN